MGIKWRIWYHLIFLRVRMSDNRHFMDGVLLVDKPSGLTSAQVVSRIKKTFGIIKIGHCGTLDPLATGLLIVLCGKATKLQELVLMKNKAYSGVIRFGIQTNTDDICGEVIHSAPFSWASDENITKQHLGKLEAAFR